MRLVRGHTSYWGQGGGEDDYSRPILCTAVVEAAGVTAPIINVEIVSDEPEHGIPFHWDGHEVWIDGEIVAIWHGAWLQICELMKGDYYVEVVPCN